MWREKAGQLEPHELLPPDHCTDLEQTRLLAGDNGGIYLLVMDSPMCLSSIQVAGCKQIDG